MRSSTSARTPSTRWVAVALGATFALLLTASPPPADAARGFATVCPDPAPTAYADEDEISAAHLAAVRCLTKLGVVQGYGSGVGEVYLPDAEVTRAQMATFVAQMLLEADVPLPEAGDQGFVDVEDGDVHASSIRRLAAAGIVRGVGEDRYAGHDVVSRAQMATYLIQAQAHAAGVEPTDLQGGDTPFTDVAADAVHQPSIAGAVQLDITDGVSADHYAPQRDVTRAAMASFVARTLDAVTTRQTVADRDGGGLAHTVFTFLSESGRCFQVTAGDAWVTHCEPATDETLQVRTVSVDEGFTVTTGLVTDAVTRVAVEYNGSTTDLDLVETRSQGLRAWASPIVADDVDAIVAYDDADQEIARTTPDDPTSPPFAADRQPDTAAGSATG